MEVLGAIQRDKFSFSPLPTRVRFGFGELSAITQEVENLALSKVIVVTTPFQKGLGQDIVDRLAGKAVGVFSEAAMHTPVSVTEKALETLRALDADGIVSIGGGSTIGLGKALAARTDLPQIVLPTTYAGSEMTPILGETKAGIKTTRSGPEIQPEVVIYDPDLSMSLPVEMSVTSGINAIAHAIEALYSPAGNPVMDTLALEGIAALIAALPKIVTDPADKSAREQALYGAWLCGICLGNVGMALHHKLCHTLGGTFGLPHAETHTVILPHALAYNAAAVPTVIEKLKPILGDDPAQSLQKFARDLGAPTQLSALGMPQDGIARATELTLKASYPNPRRLEAQAISETLHRAWSGAAPVG